MKKPKATKPTETPKQTPFDREGAGVGQHLPRIEVTEPIIATATRANSGHCMVSDSVKAAFARKGRRTSKVLTDLQTIRFTDLDSKRRYICWTPPIAQRALLAFDKGIKPEPFKFRLKPTQVIEPEHRARKATATKPGKGPSKPRLASRPTQRGYTGPIKHGGEALPTMVGLRRDFGLRQMGTYVEEPSAKE